MGRGNGESPFCMSISGSSHMQDWVSSKCCHLVCEMHFVPFQFQGDRNGLIVVTELLYFFHMPLFQDSSKQAVAPYRDRCTRTGAREACKIVGALLSMTAFCTHLCFERCHICRLPDACCCLELLPRETSGFLTSSFITGLEGNQGFQY